MKRMNGPLKRSLCVCERVSEREREGERRLGIWVRSSAFPNPHTSQLALDRRSRGSREKVEGGLRAGGFHALLSLFLNHTHTHQFFLPLCSHILSHSLGMCHSAAKHICDSYAFLNT